MASRVRFAEDETASATGRSSLRVRSSHKDNMLRNGILISKEVTPELHKRLQAVCQSLRVSEESISAFVYSSSEINADCLMDSDTTCVLRFSSGLVNLMDEHEFKFVCGHEIAHFLFRHGACEQNGSETSPEGYMLSRAKELSADRLGYLAIGNIDESIQAIMKTASGLGEAYLRFDIASFLSQKDKISSNHRGQNQNTTHPSMIVRCKALLWFAAEIRTLEEINDVPLSVIAQIDKQVTRDLEKYVDGPLRQNKKNALADLILWRTAQLVVQDGKFRKSVQDKLKKRLSNEAVSGLLSFFELFSVEELPNEISLRLTEATNRVYADFPSSSRFMEEKAWDEAQLISESK